MNTISRDEDDLKLLSSSHNILGGIVLAISGFPLLLFLRTIFGLSSISGYGTLANDVALALMLLIPMLLFLSLGVAMIFAGRLLVKLKNYSFVRSTGFLECAFFPFGTILGIFTIVVLSRESVRKLFNSKASNPPPLPGKDKEVWDY